MSNILPFRWAGDTYSSSLPTSSIFPFTSLSPHISTTCLTSSFCPSMSTWHSRLIRTGQLSGVTDWPIALQTDENETPLLKVYPCVTIRPFEDGHTSISTAKILAIGLWKLWLTNQHIVHRAQSHECTRPQTTSQSVASTKGRCCVMIWIDSYLNLLGGIGNYSYDTK